MTIDALSLTIIFIIAAAFIGAFVRGRRKDKCLKSFSGDMVTLVLVDSRKFAGRLRVETTGVELVYADKAAGGEAGNDERGEVEGSFIFYRSDFGSLSRLLRLHSMLDAKARRERDRELRRTYHPNFLRRFCRKLANIFRTVRDSIVEVVNVLLAQARGRGVGGAVLTSQDKYIGQMKQEIFGSVNTSFEPLLESYIGRRVVAEFRDVEKVVNYRGVLKDYSAEFVELLDVECGPGEGTGERADVVLPRTLAAVRHLGE